MDDSEKIEFLGGEVDALLTFISALIQQHGDQTALEKAYQASQELQTTTALNTAVSERFLEGQASVRQRIQTLFLSAALRKGA